ncbi:MAG: OmpH family outer membrane protein [Phycisphaerales bacterium]
MVLSVRKIGVALCGAALLGVCAASVAVSAARMGPPPAVIATVNLEEAIKTLDERAMRENELKSFSETLQGELDKLVKMLKDEDTKMKVLDGDQKREAASRILEMQATAEAKKKIYEARIDQRRGEVFRNLYEKITAASRRLAEQNAYTMVIASDEGVQVPMGPSADIERTISLKRFLYVGKAHDATTELVSLMNNEFKSGVGAAAPMPTGKP